MYHKCPFKIVYDSLELEPQISRLVLKYLTNNNTVLNLMVILILKMSGVLVNVFQSMVLNFTHSTKESGIRLF